jgi:UDP-2-acetamido-2-deoxy-ribo-hexuluronate aminotransferase
MRVPFCDLRSQYKKYRGDIDTAISEVVESGQFILGPKVAELESELQGYVEANHCISCANGTDALVLSLMALDIGPGDEVIVPAFTFVATAEAVSLVGAIPIFADVDPTYYTLCPDKVEQKISSNTRAIIPVSIFGQPCDMDRINEIGTKSGAMVIEDAAQSFGATYRERKSCNLSAFACTSFFPSKPLGCYGDGGAIFTQGLESADLLKALRVHGQTKRYVHRYTGTNSRLDSLQASVLLVKLKNYQTELKNRQRIASNYLTNLKPLADRERLVLPQVNESATSSWAQFTIQVKDRESVIFELEKYGIPTAIHYPIPLNEQEAFRNLGDAGRYPVSSALSKTVLSLPMSAFLKDEHQDYICEKICHVLKRPG